MSILEEKTIVVAGGTGGVGEGIVRACLKQGARVVVPWRTAAKRDRLQKYVEDVAENRLILREASVGDEESVNTFQVWIEREIGNVDLAVACLGGSYYGYSLHNMPYQDWTRVIHDHLTTHFLFARAMVSLMHRQHFGTYLMINGGASKLVAPESGVVSIVAAAAKMMTKVLAEEAHGTNVKIRSVVAFDAIKTRDRGIDAVEDWLSAEDLGDYLVRVYQGDVRRPEALIHTVHDRKDAV